MIAERSRTSGLTGCLVWALLFGVLSSCLCPSTMFVGGFASTLQADAVAGIVDGYYAQKAARART